MLRVGYWQNIDVTANASSSDESGHPAGASLTAATATVGVVIPSGGTARRLGGTDKPALDVGGRSILARLVADLRPLPIVIVGPRPVDLDDTPLDVMWCTEDPPRGGPAAAIAAGANLLPDVDVIVAIAGDQPFAASAVPRLVRALMASPTADAALGVDGDGRDQPLLAAYRAAALRVRLDGPVDGFSMRRVTAGLGVVRVALTVPESVDVDDPGDLAAARGITLEP